MNNTDFAAQAVPGGPMTLAPPSFNGHGWLVVVNLAGFAAGFIIATMLALKMYLDIWRHQPGISLGSGSASRR